MHAQPAQKYHPTAPINMPNRQWPSQVISQAPIWLSTDLRDGNQALFEPMNVDTKIAFFEQLIRIGFKEIEVGFPAASQLDFEMVRRLIEEDRIPDDVTIMVMTQAREDLIARSVESVRGAKRAIVHIYNATAPVWRDWVFGMSVEQVMGLIRHHVGYFKQLTDAIPDTQWTLQYSPETFSMTELEVALQACNTAIDTWEASPTRPIIINLPTTVENATPNVFADQVEWMSMRLNRREHVVLSVHTHNDRGTGVAAAELAMMAGAQRVEGCLFGNGERSGNVDIVTLALNMYTQGVHPQLDFSDLPQIARLVEDCTQIAIHPRHPYAGDLVFTAFSGSHQDAIKKGFAQQQHTPIWQVPYLPIDPVDIGRQYDSIIRINSQSGKGGIAYLLEQHYGIVMPRRMQIEFSQVVQRHNDSTATEMTAPQLWQLFVQTYIAPADASMQYQRHRLSQHGEMQQIDLALTQADERVEVQGTGNGPIAATVNAIEPALQVVHFEERAQTVGSDAQAVAVIELRDQHTGQQAFGVGVHGNSSTAAVMAVVSAGARLGVCAAVEALV